MNPKMEKSEEADISSKFCKNVKEKSGSIFHGQWMSASLPVSQRNIIDIHVSSVS
tara:strand:- start:2691 stop:2855 length:165 start_codon:yes stop_codon:yes gene_type:complete